jgi:hypothetical protein
VRAAPILSTCLRCGGRAHAGRDVAGEYTDAGGGGVWLHLDQEDWMDDPHPVVPDPRDADALLAAIRRQRDAQRERYEAIRISERWAATVRDPE